MVRWLWIAVGVFGSVVDRSFVAGLVVRWPNRWWIIVLQPDQWWGGFKLMLSGRIGSGLVC